METKKRQAPNDDDECALLIDISVAPIKCKIKITFVL